MICELCGKDATTKAWDYMAEMERVDGEEGFEEKFVEQHFLCNDCGGQLWLDRMDAWHTRKREHCKKEPDREY